MAVSRLCQIAKDVASAAVLVGISATLGIALNSVRETPVNWDFHSIIGMEGEHKGTNHLSLNLLTLDQMRGLVGTPSVAVIDARSPGFFALGHIPGAFNLARSILGKNPKAWQADAARILNRKRPEACVVYCSDEDCTDSTVVAGQLIALGWKNVSVFKGGWEEWMRNNLAVEKEQ